MDKGALGTSAVWRTQVDQAKVYSRTSRLSELLKPGLLGLGFLFLLLPDVFHRYLSVEETGRSKTFLTEVLAFTNRG
jgi:hypothetical protein